MADVDIDPFGEHESRTDEPTDEHISLTPVRGGRSTWEPDRGEQPLYLSLNYAEMIHNLRILRWSQWWKIWI